MIWTVFAAAVLTPAAPAPPTPATIAALPAQESAGFGATLPFVEYEAENAKTNGVPIGPSRRFTTLAAEASGRRAVRLEGQGRFVEFTLARPANALTARIAVPDGADGRGIDSTLGVYVGGRRIGSLATTSRYGWFYGAYPFTNRPADGRAHHFFDEPRLLLDRRLPAGTRVQLRIGKQDHASWYVVDLADFEDVAAPAPQPPGSVSLLSFGADASGRDDSSTAFRRAVAYASRTGQVLWIPPGTFRVNGHVLVDRVTIAGAGPWHSVLRGERIGLYGLKSPSMSRRVVLRGFALFGEVKERVDHDQVNGIGGAIGGGSLIEDVWIQHVKVGLWFDGPMDGITVRRLRILDTTADGLNFHRGVSDAVVEESFVRNTGDDGLAAWSGGLADRNIMFRRNTVVLPVLANGIALYGGHDLEVSGNLVADAVTEGGGLHVGNRFSAVPLSGAISIRGNAIVRASTLDPRWRFGVGGFWVYALDAPIDAAIDFRANRIVDSSEEAILLLGKPIKTLTIDGLAIEGASHALALRSVADVTLHGVRAGNLRGAAILLCVPAPAPTDLGDNSGLRPRTSEGCAPPLP